MGSGLRKHPSVPARSAKKEARDWHSSTESARVSHQADVPASGIEVGPTKKNMTCLSEL